MRTNYEKWKDSLRAKKYEPIPEKELNEYAATNVNRDAVVNSLQRIVSQSINKKIFYTNEVSDDVLFDLISVANEAIARAMNRYVVPNYSFAAYAKSEIGNAINSYFKFESEIIKTRVVDGERVKAKYLFIDTLFSIGDDEGFSFDVEDEDAELSIQQPEPIEKDYVFSLLTKVKRDDFDLWWSYRIVGAKNIKKANTNEKFNHLTAPGLMHKVHRIDGMIKENEILKKKVKDFFDLS